MEEMGKKTVSLDRLKPGEKGVDQGNAAGRKDGAEAGGYGVSAGKAGGMRLSKPVGRSGGVLCYGSVGCDPAGGSGEDSSRNRKRDGKWG